MLPHCSIVRGEPVFSVFGKPRQDVLATLFLRIHDHGFVIDEVFAGLWSPSFRTAGLSVQIPSAADGSRYTWIESPGWLPAAA